MIKCNDTFSSNDLTSFIDSKTLMVGKLNKNKKRKPPKSLSIGKAILVIVIIVMFIFLIKKYIEFLLLSSAINNNKILKSNRDLLNFLFSPFESDIIESLDELQMIRDWIAPSRKVGVRLIYKATIHGDTSIIFHRRTDKNTNYVFLMKTSKSRFGGYTSRNFRSDNFMSIDNGINTYDRNSFLFCLTQKTKYVISPEHSHNALTCDEDYGPIFGNGDLTIVNKFLHSKSSSKFPASYVVDNKDETLLLTQGETEFQLLELEAYHIVFSD